MDAEAVAALLDGLKKPPKRDVNGMYRRPGISSQELRDTKAKPGSGDIVRRTSGRYIRWQAEQIVCFCIREDIVSDVPVLCREKTNYKVAGIPMCLFHAACELNRLLEERDQRSDMATINTSPEAPEVGDKITLILSGWTHSGTGDISIKYADGNEEAYEIAFDSSGDATLDGDGEGGQFSVEEPGTIKIVVTDSGDLTAELDLEVTT